LPLKHHYHDMAEFSFKHNTLQKMVPDISCFSIS
jgi:hypothetical protein